MSQHSQQLPENAVEEMVAQAVAFAGRVVSDPITAPVLSLITQMMESLVQLGYTSSDLHEYTLDSHEYLGIVRDEWHRCLLGLTINQSERSVVSGLSIFVSTTGELKGNWAFGIESTNVVLAELYGNGLVGFALRGGRRRLIGEELLAAVIRSAMVAPIGEIVLGSSLPPTAVRTDKPSRSSRRRKRRRKRHKSR